MISGKNIGYIALLAIAGVLIYYYFFRKKKADSGKEGANTANTGTKTTGRHVDRDLTAGMIVSLKPETKPSEQSYVGPQDCAENCNLPYHNRLLYCYERMDGRADCLEKAERFKQECLAKCSDTIPRYKNLEEVATPLQEENYDNKLFESLFKQGYV
jgi:hypothetical protein